ncbi:MAG TPA: shikimate kinase [Devosia sp.]|nr:shikimate kinase [Devosia sp.]
MNHAIRIDRHRPWQAAETIFLIGPGGVGKSTIGHELAQRLNWPAIDLDLEFCDTIAEIGWFIKTNGYELYRAENLALAHRLVCASDRPVIFITSSGFLAGEPGSSDYRDARQLVQTGYAITLLPSLDIALATAIVIDRQLTRGFGFQRETETEKFRKRFAIYRAEGDMRVISVAPPPQIAAAIEQALEI